MYELNDTKTEHDYWANRYENHQMGWDIGYPSTPLAEYIDQLEDRSLRILIPGAGNAYEAQYLFEKGFLNTSVLDIAEQPLEAFKTRVPEFPKQQLIQANFFEHEGKYDLILEQTFFCSFYPSPENRHVYAQKMNSLLTENGKLAGVWFEFPLVDDWEKRPFGGSKEEYETYFKPHFHTHVFEPCHNSIPPRQGRELFGIFKKK
jgi:thiopurine S-methyltransferase